jgi:hypothetical protein
VTSANRGPARGRPNIIALYINDKATGITVEPDAKWPGMYRVRQDGTLSDMVNLSRAKDAALTWARPRGLGGKEVASWRVRETRRKAPHSDYSGPGAPTYPDDKNMPAAAHD